jgi:hypothetical protein
MCNIKSLELLDFLSALQRSITLCNIWTHGRVAVFARVGPGAMELLGLTCPNTDLVRSPCAARGEAVATESKLIQAGRATL